MANQDFFEAARAVEEFERQLKNHPLREQWLPRLDELTAKVEDAFQAKDLSAFDVAIHDLGDYIVQIKRETEQFNHE